MNRTRRLLTVAAVTLLPATAGHTVHSALGPAVAVGNDEKVLHLTFDDGPGDETVEILDVLREHDAVAAGLLEARSADVVLMHDGGGDRTQTVAALRAALPRLTAAGFTFDVVPGC